MARLARAVFPGHPHHVTQRGDGRATTFFNDDDYRHYRDLLAEYAAASEEEDDLSRRLRRAETIGRPVGDPKFLEALERDSGRALAPARRGRKRRN